MTTKLTKSQTETAQRLVDGDYIYEALGKLEWMNPRDGADRPVRADLIPLRFRYYVRWNADGAYWEATDKARQEFGNEQD